jgi:7-cyano-7-deazaguanine tRNA-ribosyltransferase
MFEIKHSDLAGRIGRLYTKHGVIDTPAFLPVVHPIRQEVSIEELKRMGFKAVITNAYITLKEYKNARDIHEIIGFDGPIMTDSGGYQVLVYGSIDVDHITMANFQSSIGSDIAVPLDKPTGFNLPRSKAEQYVELTLKAAEDTINMAKAEGVNSTIWAAPIQGGEHLDLVEYSSMRLLAMGYEFFALGSPTELMEAYEFYTLARMIASARKVIPLSKPLHLFGAGHPLTIPLAVALGCDTFDSASYMLYAKDGRYMLSNGTCNIKDLDYLPCNCPVCSRYTAKELKELGKHELILNIALHNLYTIKREVEHVKHAIVEGRLWEYVIQKSLSHPRLMDANHVLKECKYIEVCTPLYKDRALLLNLPIDQYRPELSRFRRSVIDNYTPRSDILVLLKEPEEHPFYASREYRSVKALNINVSIAYYNPFIGVVPEELSDMYPSSHMLAVKNVKYRDFPTLIDSIVEFIGDRFRSVIIEADDELRTLLEDRLKNAIFLSDIESIVSYLTNKSKEWML